MNPSRLSLVNLALAAQLGLLLAGGARAESLSLHPVQDVLVASNDISVDVRNLGVSNRGEGYVRRTLLQFDITDIVRSGRPISSASLKLVPSGVIGKEGGVVPISLWGLTEEVVWNEAAIFWSNSPKRTASLEVGRAAPGVIRLASADFDADSDTSKRAPVLWTDDALASYLNAAASRATRSGVATDALVTLILASEGDLKTPGVIFYSKDNRPVAKSVFPALQLELK